MKGMDMEALLTILETLSRAKIHYILESNRDAIMVIVPSPSGYFEVEYFADGHIELQSFGPASGVDVVTAAQVLELLATAVNGD